MKRVEQRCAILSEVVRSVRPVYEKSDPDQAALIETMIGAAIWYVPKPVNAWTGRISIAALQAFHRDKGTAKLSEEHVYPRKVVARLLLKDESLDQRSMFVSFTEKYGRLHYITPQENKAVQTFQRVDRFTTPDEAYQKAGIVLVEVGDAEALREIKKGNRAIIERYLEQARGG